MERGSDEGSKSVSRRTALKALGTGAVGLTALAAGTVSGAGRTVEIDVVKRGEKAVVTEDVPAKWYEHERRATDVAERIRGELADRRQVSDVALATGSGDVSGYRTSAVDVTLASDADGRPDVPASVGGVDVRSRIGERPDPACAMEPTTVVEGGTSLTTEAGVRTTATGTIRWRGDRYVMTCAHLFDCSDRVAENGASVFTGGEFVGDVVAQDVEQDWLLVDDAGVSTTFGETVEGADAPLVGRVTEVGLRYLKSKDLAVEKHGVSTGTSEGSIQRVNSTHGGCSLGDGRFGERYVDVDVPTEHGDSGGPIYRRVDYDGEESVALVGLTSAIVDVARASSAYSIYAKHGIRFDPGVP